jgi:Uma2 family endonuclease
MSITRIFASFIEKIRNRTSLLRITLSIGSGACYLKHYKYSPSNLDAFALTIFRLPNGGKRSPDAAWVANERWDALTEEERRKFPPIAPDFVIELRSATDDLAMLQAKMQEYLESGVRLGWLINPQAQQVEIYRRDATIERLDLPIELSGEDVLPGLILTVPIF